MRAARSERKLHFDNHLFLVLILVLALPFQDEDLEEVSWRSRRRVGGGDRSGDSTKGYSLVSK